MDVGDVDAKATRLSVPIGTSPTEEGITTALLSKVPAAARPVLARFLCALLKFYVDLAFTYLEINPVVVTANGEVAALDLAAKVDLTAQFDCAKMCALITS